MNQGMAPTAGGSVAIVLGATGLVGTELVRQLLAAPHIGRVVALVRRRAAPEAIAPGLRAKLDMRVVDYEHLPDVAGAFTGVDAIFCALGTTIKEAGSRDRFRRVDHHYPIAAARLGLEAGARHFLLVSAVGADPRSRVFYNRVKGEVERELLSLGYPQVTIVRPSLLLGNRARPRLGEELAKRLAWLVPRRWAPVHAADVAAAMIAAAARAEVGIMTLESASIPRRE